MEKDVPFFVVYADLFYSPQFQKLSPSTRLLYIDMGIASCGNKDDFTFPYRLYKDRYSKATFANGIKELEKYGFIKATRYYKQETHYVLSFDWMRVLCAKFKKRLLKR